MTFRFLAVVMTFSFRIFVCDTESRKQPSQKMLIYLFENISQYAEREMGGLKIEQFFLIFLSLINFYQIVCLPTKSFPLAKRAYNITHWRG